ncbi:MAG: hypothetical protein WCB96_00395 [Candidatus Aminicenantales bacterium]
MDMLFGRATATGTEFFTIIDSPFEGAVSVVAGTVSFEPHGLVVDPQTGNIEPGYWTKDLTVEGEAFTVYPRNQGPAQALKWGDYFKLSIDALVNPPYVTGSKITHVTDSAWVQRNRNLLRMIEALRRARQRGRLSPNDYRQKLSDLLGIGSQGMDPNNTMTASGGLYVGMTDAGDILKFCVESNMVDSISYVGTMFCADKQTQQDYSYSVNLSLGEMVFFPVGAGGLIDQSYKFMEGVYKDVVFYFYGRVQGSGGQVYIMMTSDNDVAMCQGASSGAIAVIRSPAPCIRY